MTIYEKCREALASWMNLYWEGDDCMFMYVQNVTGEWFVDRTNSMRYDRGERCMYVLQFD